MSRLVIFHIGALLFCSQSFGNPALDQYPARQPGLKETVSLGRKYVEGKMNDWSSEDQDFGRQILESVASQDVDLKSKAESLKTLKLLSSASVELGLQYILGQRGKRNARDIKYGRQLLEQEAEQDYVPTQRAQALSALGEGYLEGYLGNRAEEDLNRGLIALQLASEQSDDLEAQAQANALMGVHLMETRGNSSPIRKKAVGHLKSAAKQKDNRWAQSLGKFGLGQAAVITQDYKTALKRFGEVTPDHPLAYLRAQGMRGQLYASGLLGQSKKAKAYPYLIQLAARELPQPDPTRKHLPLLTTRQKEADTILAAQRKILQLQPLDDAIPALETVQ